MTLRAALAATAAALIVAGAAVAPAPAAMISCTTPPLATVRMDQSKAFNPSCSGPYAGTVIDRHPAHGTLDHVPFGFGALEYTPDPGYLGPDSFDYHAQDGAGYHTPPVTQQLNVVSDANTAPTCAAPSSTPTVRQGTPKQITLPCSDPDGDALAIEITSGPGRGTISEPTRNGSSYVVTYTVTNPGGTDAYSFRAYDGRAYSETRTQSVKAVAADYNTPPHCNDQTITVRAGESTGISVFACSDADGDPLTMSVVREPTQGATTVYPSSGINYKANLDASGTDSFTFTVNDGFVDAMPATTTVTIEAAKPPDCFEQTDPVAYIGQDTTIRLYCRPGSDGLPITFTIDDGPDHHSGTFTQQSFTSTSADYVYHPVDGYHGPDSITWHGTGPNGLTSATRTFSFTVEDPPANRPPTCNGYSETTVRNNTTRELTFWCTDHDPGDDNVLEVVQDPAHGQITGIDSSNDGYLKLTYDPVDTYEGRDSFSVHVRDGRGGTSATLPVGVDVLRADYNRAPRCMATGGYSMKGGTNAWDRLCSDADSDPITYAITRQPSHGVASVESGATVVRYTATDPDFEGYDTFDFTVSDDHGGVTPWTFQVQVGQPPMSGGGAGGGGTGGGGGGGGATPAAPSSTDAPAPPADAPPDQPASPRPSAPSTPVPSSARPPADLDLGPGATAFLTRETTDGSVTLRGTAPAPLLVLACEQRCEVRATPELILSGLRARAARTLRLKPQRLSIAAGRRATLKLQLTKAQRAAIRRVRTAKVRLSLTVRDSDGHTVRDRTAFRIALR